MKTVGYCRITRKEQSIERQARNIQTAFPDAVIIREVYTGTKVDRLREFEKLIAKANDKTRIIFDSVSRMGKGAEDAFRVYQDLFQRGTELVFIKEPHINTGTYKAAMEKEISSVEAGKAAADELIRSVTTVIYRYTLELAEKQIYLAFQQAEKKVKDQHQRTKEGMEKARLAGKQIGNVKGRKLNVKKAGSSKEAILKYNRVFDGTLNDKETIKLIGIAPNTFYKYKRELKEAYPERICPAYRD